VVIDSDAKNEIDDQYALALAMLSPERFALEGFIGAQFDNQRGGSGSIQASVQEILRLMDMAAMAGRWPVLPGADPIPYHDTPSRSAGVDFLIEKAMSADPDNPLWIVGLGAATDMASAYLLEPRIAERVVVFWHFRTRWPEACTNFNIYGDVKAARLLFHSPLSFVLGDTGAQLTCTMEESERRVKPYGRLGEYLHEYRHTDPGFSQPQKGFYDLAEIAALLDPEAARWEVVECPEVGYDLSYRFRGGLGSLLRCYDVDRDRAFGLLFEKLAGAFG
jgi:hypothetical protein